MANETPNVNQRLRSTIRPSRGWQALDLAELWRFRDLLWTLGSRDIKVRYKQTLLGPVWVVLQPLLSAGLFTFVFGYLAKLPSDGIPYPIFSYAGTLGWNLFSSVLTRSSGSLIGNAHLVAKVYFPRLVLPFSTIMAAAVDFAVALSLLLVAMFAYGIAPGPGILLLPIWLTLLALLSLGMGLMLGSIMVYYRDITSVVNLLSNVVLYLSPVAYSGTAIPPFLRPIYYLNPICGLLEAVRWSLLGRGSLHPAALAYSAMSAISIFSLGALVFRRAERDFADFV